MKIKALLMISFAALLAVLAANRDGTFPTISRDQTRANIFQLNQKMK